MNQGLSPFFVRLVIATIFVIMPDPLTPNRAQTVGPKAPLKWPLAAWAPIPDNPVFAGTGRDTWDRKIRERSWQPRFLGLVGRRRVRRQMRRHLRHGRRRKK
jgi:hypothetical protein